MEPAVRSAGARWRRQRGALADASGGLRELLALASDLARAAGTVHRDGMSRRLQLETKSSPTDLVSQVDRDTEHLIVDRLAAARPHDSVLAEEGAVSDGASGVRWIIDPLDGTTNYVYGYPAYCASIAVEIDGQTQIGVIYDSSAAHLYQGVVGFGAVRDGAALAVRDDAELPRSLVATGFSYLPERRACQGKAAAYILSRVRDIRRGGSAALDLCRVAAGQVDAFYELYLNPWDYAAGRVIAIEAGADVVLLGPETSVADTVPGSAESVRSPAVIAASPRLLPAFLRLLHEADALTPI